MAPLLALSSLLAATVLMPAANAAGITVSGTVACKGGHRIAGLWVSSSTGGSKWATLTRRPGASWAADYTATIAPRSRPTTIRLDLGCGDSSGNWLSNNSSPNKTGVKGSIILNSQCKEPSSTGARAVRCTWWAGSALVGMPFAGRWGKVGDGPSTHATQTSGAQWAIDLFAREPTPVYVTLVGPRSDRFTMTVAGTWSSCGGKAGKGIRINVLKNGARIGVISYTHLDRLQLSAGTVSDPRLLGYTKRWPYVAGCWKVSTADGVHTHFTAANTTGFACWAPLSLGKQYAKGRWFATVGATGVTTKRSCP